MSNSRGRPYIQLVMAVVDKTDAELLKQYIAGERPAIEELVRRHIDYVYAAALRQTGDPHQADDVTQAVFMLLARKAAGVRAEHLSSWLFKVSYCAVANARKLAARRAHHEKRAALERSEEVMPNDKLQSNPLLPLLDDALAKLPAKDREVVILRYLRGKSVAEVSAALGTSEAAVRKRIERAIDKLRRRFARRRSGTVETPAVMAVMITAFATPAPSEVVAAATHAAVSGAVPATVLSISKGVVMTLAWAKAKVAAMIVASGLLLASGGVAVNMLLAQQPATTAPAPDQRLASIIQQMEAARKKVDAVRYVLVDEIPGTMFGKIPNAPQRRVFETTVLQVGTSRVAKQKMLDWYPDSTSPKTTEKRIVWTDKTYFAWEVGRPRIYEDRYPSFDAMRKDDAFSVRTYIGMDLLSYGFGLGEYSHSLADTVKLPNIHVEVSEEAINGGKDYILDWTSLPQGARKSRQRVRVNSSKGYLITRVEHFENESVTNSFEVFPTEIAPGVWFPTEVIIDAKNQDKRVAKARDILLNPPIDKNTFTRASLGLPEATLPVGDPADWDRLESPRKQFEAKLKNGMNVSLVALVGTTAPVMSWWRPDGTHLMLPFDRTVDELYPVGAELSRGQPEESRYIGAAVCIKYVRPLDCRIDVSSGSTLGMHHADAVGDWQWVMGYLGYARVAVAKDQQSANVLVRMFADSWKTVMDVPIDQAADGKPHQITVPDVGKLTLLKARGDDSSTSIDVVAEQPGMGYVKVVDDAGKEHHGLRENEYAETVTIKFDLPPKRVRAFRVQARPISGWVEFRNVSLREGHKTDVKVVTSDDEPTPLVMPGG